MNLGLNALFLFGFHWGVWGVALATGISRLVNLLWLVIAASRRIHVSADLAPPANRVLLGQIISIGLPAAMETSLYNLAITLVIRFLNQMDDAGMQATARSMSIWGYFPLSRMSLDVSSFRWQVTNSVKSFMYMRFLYKINLLSDNSVYICLI